MPNTFTLPIPEAHRHKLDALDAATRALATRQIGVEMAIEEVSRCNDENLAAIIGDPGDLKTETQIRFDALKSATESLFARQLGIEMAIEEVGRQVHIHLQAAIQATESEINVSVEPFTSMNSILTEDILNDGIQKHFNVNLIQIEKVFHLKCKLKGSS
jgi:hypothetical protein